MANYIFKKSTSVDLAPLMQQYVRRLSAPLDGMWVSFIADAVHYAIVFGDQILGYFVINSERQLLQIFISSDDDRRPVFRQLVEELNVEGAIVSTFESDFLAMCMDHQVSVTVNSLLYCIEPSTVTENAVFPQGSQFRIAEECDLQVTVDFAFEALGADPEWLRSYFQERIEGGELFGLWHNNGLTGTGECRPSKSQTPYADLGMIVAKDHRGKGIATNILRRLIQRCREKGLSAICSTERDNIASQKAIAKSGFVCHHRILRIEFNRRSKSKNI